MPLNGGRWQYTFIPTGKYKSLSESFQNEILQLSEQNKIILIYPVPEICWDPQKKFFLKGEKFNLNTSYNVFKERTKSSFELLNSIEGKNIYRVYPHELFCDSLIPNRCITHDKDKLYYFDNVHPSLDGTELINNLIIKEINKIEKSYKENN